MCEVRLMPGENVPTQGQIEMNIGKLKTPLKNTTNFGSIFIFLSILDANHYPKL